MNIFVYLLLSLIFEYAAMWFGIFLLLAGRHAFGKRVLAMNLFGCFLLPRACKTFCSSYRCDSCDLWTCPHFRQSK